MNFLKSIVLLMTIAFMTTSCDAKINNPKTETVKVYGNCEMCKERIEKAVKLNKDAKGNWNAETKKLALTYDSLKTTAGEILKRIADAGHDNDQYIANDAVYDELPECCRYDRKEVDRTPTEAATTHPTHIAAKTAENDSAKSSATHSETASPVNNEHSITKTDFTPILLQYYAVKNALVADNGILANKNAAVFLTGINALKMESMSSEEHMIWMKFYDRLRTDATKISSVKDIEKQRTAFSSLSVTMWSAVKALKIKNEGAIYYDYCPMKEMYWLSEVAGIKNPYYGKAMLTCGSIKETIK